MPLLYKKNINGAHNRTLVKVLLNNSTDFRVGDVVTTGTAEEALQATAGIRVLGVIAAIVTDGGVSPSSNGCGGAFVNTYRTASDNETVAKVSALVDIDPNSLYSAPLSDTIGTTTGSNKAFYMFDVVTGSDTTGVTAATLGETSASTGSGQFYSLGLDPDNTNRIMVKIRESVLHGDSGY